VGAHKSKHFILLITIIFHVFCCLKILIVRWNLCVSILKIIAYALGCHGSIVWIIFCYFLVHWCTPAFILQGAAVAVYCYILNCLL
jgi:hypothetical protein